MKWLDLAYGFLFFANLLFMVGAGFVLYRIEETVRQGRVDLLKAANLSMEASKQLKLAANRTANDLERVVQAHHARDNMHGRALQELSFQLKNISDQVARQESQMRFVDTRPGDDTAAEDHRARLQAELNKALARNHLLQEQLDRAVEEARNSEQIVSDQAGQLDALRGQINTLQPDKPAAPVSAEEAGMLTQERRELLDKFAAREKALLAQIDQLEQALKRQVTEQSFIEDHYLQLEAGRSPPAPPEASATPAT